MEVYVLYSVEYDYPDSNITILSVHKTLRDAWDAIGAEGVDFPTFQNGTLVLKGVQVVVEENKISYMVSHEGTSMHYNIVKTTMK